MESFESWEKNSYLSEGQKQNLVFLYNRLNYNVDINTYLLKQHKIEDINSITYNKYYYLSKIFEKRIKLTTDELDYVRNKFTIEEIIDLIDIHSYSDIRLYDIRKLLKYNTDVNMINMIHDKSNIPTSETKVLKHTTEYEYGIQKSKSCHNNEMYYIKYFNIMMIDFDRKDLQEIKKLLDTRFAYRIYRTYKGYHVFVVSLRINYNNQFQLTLTQNLKGDTMYAYYSYFNGFNVRLTPKIGYNEEKTHIFQEMYGNLNTVDTEINNILENTIDKEIIETEHFFYDKYLKLEYPDVNKVPSTYVDYLIKNVTMDVNNIKMLSKFFVKYIKKPQRYLYFNDDYYIGVDMNTGVHYMCFNDIVMFDIDNKNFNDIIFNDDDSYMVYETQNGYHVFLTNRRIEYGSDESIEYMIKMKTDTKYIICSYLRGYSVRINKKNNNQMYKLVYVHNEEKENKEIVKLVNDHIDYSELFWEITN